MSLTKRGPKTRAGKKFLENAGPKLHENPKQALFMFGTPSSQLLKDLFRDLSMMTKPNSKLLDRKKDCRPFEDIEPIEHLSLKNDASLFAFATHNKKRPHNMIIGRMFNHKLLDMVELGVKSCMLLKDFACEAHGIGAKPCLTFAGELFDTDPIYMQLKSVLIDFFRGVVVDNVALSGLDHVISFTAADGEIAMRHYRILLKKSGGRVPLVDLAEMGPRVDFELRRSQQPTSDLKKDAERQPVKGTVRKRKNLETNVLGDTLGRIHMMPQTMSYQTRKSKALKKSHGDSAISDAAKEAVANLVIRDEPEGVPGDARIKRSKDYFKNRPIKSHTTLTDVANI